MAVAPPEAEERRGGMNSAIAWAPDSSSVSDRPLLSCTLSVIVFLGKHSFLRGFQVLEFLIGIHPCTGVGCKIAALSTWAVTSFLIPKSFINCLTRMCSFSNLKKKLSNYC